MSILDQHKRNFKLEEGGTYKFRNGEIVVLSRVDSEGFLMTDKPTSMVYGNDAIYDEQFSHLVWGKPDVYKNEDGSEYLGDLSGEDIVERIA